MSSFKLWIQIKKPDNMIQNFKTLLSCCDDHLLFHHSYRVSAKRRYPEGCNIQEKSETITFRMEKELALTNEQSTHVMKVLIERFRELERAASGFPLSLEIANRKALQKLADILNDQQYALYQELRTKSKRVNSRKTST
jgi:hypothetical protein